MRVHNVHQRELDCAPAVAGALLDRLATPDDPLWPREHWPPMRFAGRGEMLAVGLSGGHGPVRYDIERYEPGRRVEFRFRAPRGFDGTHCLEIQELADTDGADRAKRCLLRHEIAMRLRGRARLSWPLVFGPLHDALLEDALDRAERASGSEPQQPARWSFSVRLLRALVARLRRSASR